MAEGIEGWRLIVDGRRPSESNMPRDLELFEEVRRGALGGCLRFYNWLTPAVTIGCHQKGFAPFAPVLDIPVYRRPTGGGAVLHADDITYSVITPLEGLFALSIAETYAAIAGVFALALKKCGLNIQMGVSAPGFSEVCFARTAPVELKLGGVKLMGAAQLRRGGILLQQGVIPRRIDSDLQDRTFGPGLRAGGILDFMPEFSVPEFIGYLKTGFGERMGLNFEEEFVAPGIDSW